MNIKFLLSIALITILTAAFAASAHAEEKTAGSSASIISTVNIQKADPRVEKLQKYLEKYDSPLAPYAEVFITEADKNRLDWKFVVAISGVESTFGKHIPSASYNGWGWGVYGDNVMRFTSWEDAIVTISGDIRSKYMNTWGATDVYSIGRIYAASPTWAQRVTYFMNQIDTFEEEKDPATLPISI